MISTQTSTDVRALAESLKALSYGGSISLNQLSAAIGRDIRQCRYLVYAAMRVALRETGAVFATERGKGYVRLHPSDAHKIGATARRRVRKTTGTAARSIQAAIGQMNDADEDVKRAAYREVSTLGLLQHIARDSSAPPMTNEDNAPLPVAVTAKRFLAQIGAV